MCCDVPFSNHDLPLPSKDILNRRFQNDGLFGHMGLVLDNSPDLVQNYFSHFLVHFHLSNVDFFPQHQSSRTNKLYMYSRLL